MMININKQSITNFIIILDIDETLAHTSSIDHYWNILKIRSDPQKIDLRDRTYVFNLISEHGKDKKDIIWGSKRPHLKEFLNFCFNYFKIVIVWSAGMFEYVHHMVDELFKDTYEPALILTRLDCVITLDNIEKPLWKLLDLYPELIEYIDLDQKSTLDPYKNTDYFKNIFLIDDREVNFTQNPNNGIKIPEYCPTEKLESLRQDDSRLLQLINWFKRPGVINSTDIRQLDKSHIFDDNIHMHTGHNIKPIVNQVLKQEVVYT